MVQKEISFSDGTRIFYEKANGVVQRFIEYSISPLEKEEMRQKPFLKSEIESKNRKNNAGKFYYLAILRNLAGLLNDNQKIQLYNELRDLHDRVGKEYDRGIINEKFKNTFGKYFKGNEIQSAAFFVTIYLAMLDLEENRDKFPRSMGKTMVLKSCEAVILEGKDPETAAKMFKKRRESIERGYYSDVEEGSRYEKYHGYNGFDDDTIDEAFDGCPEATWNVD